jgi:heat shock protein HtpX
MKRILMFLVTNIAVLVVLSIVAHVLGVDAYVANQGGNWTGLLAFAAVFGFGGALISLFISKWSAKRLMGVRVLGGAGVGADEQWLLTTVAAQATRAGIGMPEVGIFDSADPNAFATGASRNNALVAVSTGLLQRLSRPQVEAVLGHEIAHVANGDMVTLTLIQGVLNTFVIFLARIIGNIIDKSILRNENGRGMGYMVSVFVAELLLGVLASVIVMWFSRRREFRADAGGALLAGTPNMIGALEALHRAHDPGLPQQLSAFGISGGTPTGWKRFFMSHPPIEARIAALRAMAANPAAYA